MYYQYYQYLFLAILFIAFILMLISSYNKTFKLPKKVFILLILAYIGMFLLYKQYLVKEWYWIVIRDAIGLIAVMMITRIFAKHKFMLLVCVITMVLVIKYYYWPVLNNTFIGRSKIDPNAELLIDIKNPNSVNDLIAKMSRYNLTINIAFPFLRNTAYSNLEEYYIINIPDQYIDNIEEIKDELLKTNDVDFVEENELYELEPLIEGDKKDYNYAMDFELNDPQLKNQWGFWKMNAQEYYNLISTGAVVPRKKPKLAILDTGIDGNHEDIKNNYISSNTDYDSDVQGHGTHCAGIAAAVSNNNIGIASLAPGFDFLKVTSIKVLDNQGCGSDRSIVAGIIEAADNGADVISMSLGGPAGLDKDKVFTEAIEYANNAGCIVVVAAGNESQNAKNVVPAGCKGVITVTAVDENMQMATFSNYITDIEMGIAAPGVNIYSTFPKNSYRNLSGTSMATPCVAGLVAIMKSIKPELTTKEVFQILNSTGIETNDVSKTGKFIQPTKVLQTLK